MHVEFTTPDHAAVIERLLDGFIQAGELLIRAGAAGRPTLDMVLQDDDVATWQLPQQSAERGAGDCEDLVIWWAAWLRATGKDPHARARIKNTGPKQVHCLLVTGGRIVDVYAEHLAAQAKRGDYQMGGFFSSIGNAFKSVGHGISSAASGIGHAAQAVGRGAEAAYHGASDAVHYVAHDLPKAILHEGASGLSDLVHGVGDAGSTVLNAVGDVVAGGAGDALHQWGKLGGAVANSFSSDGGGDAQPGPGPDPGPDPGGAGGYQPADPGGFGGYDDGGDDGDPWEDAGVDTSTGWEDGDADGDGES